MKWTLNNFVHKKSGLRSRGCSVDGSNTQRLIYIYIFFNAGLWTLKKIKKYNKNIWLSPDLAQLDWGDFTGDMCWLLLRDFHLVHIQGQNLVDPVVD